MPLKKTTRMLLYHFRTNAKRGTKDRLFAAKKLRGERLVFGFRGAEGLKTGLRSIGLKTYQGVKL